MVRVHRGLRMSDLESSKWPLRWRVVEGLLALWFWRHRYVVSPDNESVLEPGWIQLKCTHCHGMTIIKYRRGEYTHLIASACRAAHVRMWLVHKARPPLPVATLERG